MTGTPFTTATLSITSGVGTFADTGTTTTTVTLGPNGTGTAVLQSNVNNPGTITVSANITVSTMVQSDGGGKQDFAYLENQQITKTVTLTFTDCRLSVSKTAEPAFNRTFTWTVQKVVTSASKATVDAGGTATFSYAVTATKGPAVDSGWTVRGAITVGNPGPAVDATVSDAVAGATCTVGGGSASTLVAIPQGGTVSVPYSCSYAAKPAYNVAADEHRDHLLQRPNGSPITETASAPFTFNDGSTGNPSVTGDSATVTDTFNGGTPKSLGTITQTTTFNTSSSFVVPTTQTGCVDLPNVATVTSNGTPVDRHRDGDGLRDPAGHGAGRAGRDVDDAHEVGERRGRQAERHGALHDPLEEHRQGRGEERRDLRQAALGHDVQLGGRRDLQVGQGLLVAQLRRGRQRAELRRRREGRRRRGLPDLHQRRDGDGQQRAVPYREREGALAPAEEAPAGRRYRLAV